MSARRAQERQDRLDRGLLLLDAAGAAGVGENGTVTQQSCHALTARGLAHFRVGPADKPRAWRCTINLAGIQRARALRGEAA